MKSFFISLILLFSFALQAQLKSPAQFLPGYGRQVTYHYQVENYFNYLVQNSNSIVHKPYGQTNEERGLNAYYISAPENLRNIENIRQNHLYQIGMASKPAVATDKVIVWLSFNVHGNEPAGTESAMNVAYELVSPDNAETKEWLQNTIVILDPCLNPDGFSRYGNWLRSISGKDIHPGLNDREHMEPWPGGRENHYLYDLNRDWAWQVQAETQQRMLLYNDWMPMVHVDVHEMGFNEPYFFPPPAEPMHDFVTQAQKDFYAAIGEMTSKKFDSKGWSYYTREVFDLFYPSYGDTYPTFNGAVGMTYEQGGIGAGRAVTLKSGGILTLQDRIDHHTAAVLTAIETAAWKRNKLIANFRAYFKDSRENPKGKYNTYIVKNHGKTEELTKLLGRNKIQYAFADETKKLSGYHYQTGKEDDFILEPNDLIVSVKQPKAVLTQVLFEPEQRLSDSLSYDITAWALPLAYGVDGYALKRDLSVKTKKDIKYKGKFEYERIYAYYIPWNGRASAKLLAELHKNKIKVRSAHKESLFRGIKVSLGDLVVLKGDNPQLTQFDSAMNVMLEGKKDYEVIESGFSISGADLGAESYPLLEAPKVLLVAGKDINSTDFGQVWFYMDQIINYPVSIVDIQNFGNINFNEYNTLILPDGWYSFQETDKTRIDTFIANGGKVIAMAGALNLFEDRQGYSLTKFATDEAKNAEKDHEASAMLNARYYNYESFLRRGISSSVSGAIVENVIDRTHPLNYGLGDKYFSLKISDSCYQLLKGAANTAYIPEGYKSFGFIGSDLKKKLANTVTFAVEQKGSGQIIYMVDNPLFRGFWENGNLLFSNALFLVN
ncbi:hypothetical protein GR160_05510 [Flavobacterium sp. Sd200]|uniref:M14 family metallopeptidase n=1 Tax=Flavobacterium sp. Sd200 TaxID=2692211 RepID=UPI00136FED36|nr:M14 family metallopeptidase [Flavobacterium sp. Sd200]MXN90676.1 hypothetical protein [Flavobacterium sp. Sd200]